MKSKVCLRDPEEIKVAEFRQIQKNAERNNRQRVSRIKHASEKKPISARQKRIERKSLKYATNVLKWTEITKNTESSPDEVEKAILVLKSMGVK